MLSPAKIEGLNILSGRVVDPVTQYLLRDIARRIAQAGKITSTAGYQIWKAQELGMSRNEIKKEVAKLLEVSNNQVEEIFSQSAKAGYDFDLSKLPTTEAVKFEDNQSLQQIVKAAVKLAKADFSNITQTIGMIDPYGNPLPLNKAYNVCCDYVFGLVSTGATDYNTAVRKACKNLYEKGLVTIDYESGRHTSLEAAVRRNIMGGLGLMQEKISEDNHDKYGADGWEISAHAASAPDHEPIQGKQYRDEEYKELNGSLVRRIGTLNCGHAAFPIFYGITKPTYTAEQLEKFKNSNAEGITYQGKHYTKYEATQMQRKLERAIRKCKREITVREAAGDEEKLKIAQVRYTRLNQEYSRFSKAAGLRTQTERLHTAGFDYKQGAKASSAGGKQIVRIEKLDNTSEDDIIKLYRGANRKSENLGAFSQLEIPMQKRAVLKLCAEYGISTEGLTIKIQRDELLLSLPFCGSTDYDNIGRIDLFPRAFVNEEQLIRTILHEKCHVLQLQKYGKDFTQDNLSYMEKVADKFETIYYNALKRGKAK